MLHKFSAPLFEKLDNPQAVSLHDFHAHNTSGVAIAGPPATFSWRPCCCRLDLALSGFALLWIAKATAATTSLAVWIVVTGAWRTTFTDPLCSSLVRSISASKPVATSCTPL
jgi:hypothetical protein